MTNRLFVLLAVVFIISCKDESANPQILNYSFQGRILLSDSLTGSVRDNSNIKVTIVETGISTYTDSLGEFSFNNISPGIYGFVFEYKNYPKYYKYNVAFNSQSSSSVVDKYIGHISPLPIHTYVLDSINYGTITYANLEIDTHASVNYRRLSTVPMNTFNQLVILSKSSNSLDYINGNFLVLRAWIGGSIFSKRIDTIRSTFNYDSLKSWGFNKGDSVCFKYYPLNSVSYYTDKTTHRDVYPYIGPSSNTISMKLK